MEKIYKNRMTMFDLMKGLSIFIVVLWHSYDYFATETDLTMLKAPIYLVWPALMPIFYIANGYWYKPKAQGVFVKAQMKSVLKPYIFVGIMASLIAGTKNYFLWHSKRAALGGMSCVFLAFITGSSKDVFIKGIHIFNLGPTWFIFTLFVSGSILNFILINDKIKHKTEIIVALALFGFALENLFWTPLCISAVTEAVLSIYVGYKIKESKILLMKWDKKDYIKWSVLACIGYISALLVMCFYCESSYFVRIIPGIPEAVLLIRLGLRMEGKNNTVFACLRKIGRYSMWIYLVHSIEVLSIDWHFISNISFFDNHHFLGVLGVLFSRTIFICVGVFVISKVDGFLIRRTKHGIF